MAQCMEAATTTANQKCNMCIQVLAQTDYVLQVFDMSLSDSVWFVCTVSRDQRLPF